METKAVITISELKGYNFYVPSYQRGYRWSSQEIIAFLNDIEEFSNPKNHDKKYCLQPLAVKKNGDVYEVVDGQQRLTTIYIFMKIAQSEMKSATPPFNLKYETRSNDASFLENLSDETCNDDSDVNFYYISNAYKTMKEWINSKSDVSVIISKLNSTIRENVEFIWYEIPENSNPIEVFTKVNLGKIPLTNAELIKALLLNSDNFIEKEKNVKEILKNQLEISLSWDAIEQDLQNDSFWYFLKEKDVKKYDTRLDLLFKLLAKEYNENYNLNIDCNQEYFSFLVFSSFLDAQDNKEETINDIWKKVEGLYKEFKSWYNDLNKYHLIGYLISTGVSIEDIRMLTMNKRKKEIINILLNKAKIKYDKDTLLNLDYNHDKAKIRGILLLFNIATLIRKSEKQYRFPFDIYKKDHWDIDHIHATNDDSDDSDDTLENLTLISADLNRSYKDVEFDEKRRVINKRDSEGKFVPLCTKNVFLKVYTQNIDKMDLWQDNDKKDYIDEIYNSLDNLFNGGRL